jgi:polysaccharide deacetylase family protein (PEP-CTERM system associated)
MLNGLSFDIEEWYHAELVRERVPAADRVSQVERATGPILDLLDRRGLHATFFILGDVIRAHPAFVRRIFDAGHEIGCHTMTHIPLWNLTPEMLRASLREFRQILASVSPEAAAALIGFRAPTFSMVPKTSWALRVLADEGFGYDSSIFPVANGLYGVNGAPLAAYRPAEDDLRRADSTGPILELPMTVCDWRGVRLPISGGFYLRAIPAPLLLRMVKQVASKRPVVLYLHPWECYGRTPRVPGLPLTGRIVTYLTRSSALAKLERILTEREFGPLREVLAPMLDKPKADTVGSSGRPA